MRTTVLFAALLSTAGIAHAQTTVTLYGIADGDLRVDHTSAGTLKSVGSGGESATRWGLRGTENLGGGLSAIFNFEQGFDLTDNSVPLGNVVPASATHNTSSTGSRLFSRRAIVGLHSTTYGTLRIGRDYTPFYETWLAADPFAAGTVARATNYAVGNVSRFDNALTYQTPTRAGFTVAAQYRPSESTATFDNRPQTGQGYGASLTYANGPLYAGVAYLYQRNGTIPTKSETAAIVYDLGIAKLHALYFHTNQFNTDVGFRYQSYAAGVTVPLQAFKVRFAVARIANQDKVIDGNNDGQGARSANVFGGAVNYAFSKRTDLYLAGSKIVNGSATAFVIGDVSNNGLYTPANLPAGLDPWSAQVGIRHSF